MRFDPMAILVYYEDCGATCTNAYDKITQENDIIEKQKEGRNRI